MSKHSIETITCPQCGEKSDFMIWESINTQIDPEMKNKVRTGEAFLWKCPNCGCEASIEYSCLYHQMEDSIMIYYVPNNAEEAIKMFSEMQENKADFLGMEFGDNYTFRVVKTKNQLKEKLNILDAKLDDRIIEIMKPFLISQLDKNIHIKEMLFDIQDDEYCFAVNTEDGWGQVGFYQELYDKLVQQFDPILINDKSVVIDFKWAMDLISSN